MTYAIEQRLRMIDFLLANYGSVAPKQLVDFFGISKPQASVDFRMYNSRAPGNMIYLHATLCWYTTASFKRVYP